MNSVLGGNRFAWLRGWKTLARSRAVPVGAVSVFLGLALGWLATSPTWSMGVSGDTAAYAGEIARGSPWARTPWNSHYGIGQVYWLAAHLGRALGLTVLASLRWLNALALAGSALVICLCSLRLRLRPLYAILLPAVYLTSWGTLILACTWEDNILVHPAAIATLALCLTYVDRWSWRISIAAGLLAGLASLMSWQGASYGLPAVYAAVFLGGEPRRWWQRARDGMLVPVGLVLARCAWVAVYWLTAWQLDFAGLMTTAFERPSPNFLPKDLAGWLALPGRWRELLAHLGLGFAHEMGTDLRDAVWRSLQTQMILGVIFIGVVALAWLTIGLILRRRFSLESQLLAAALLLLTASAMVYLDLPADKYLRYDYLPILLAFGLLAACAWVGEQGGRFPWRERMVLVGLLALLVGQVALGYHTNRQWYARLSTTPAGRRIGNGNQTWFALMRSLRTAAPTACSFIFSYGELAAAQTNNEALAALVSELPDPKVIGAPASAQTWLRPLPLASAAELATHWRGCEWVSAAAGPQLPMR